MFRPLIIQRVSPVERASQPLEEIPMRCAIEQLVGGPIESCSDFAKSVVGQRVVTTDEARDRSAFYSKNCEAVIPERRCFLRLRAKKGLHRQRHCGRFRSEKLAIFGPRSPTKWQFSSAKRRKENRLRVRLQRNRCIDAINRPALMPPHGVLSVPDAPRRRLYGQSLSTVLLRNSPLLCFTHATMNSAIGTDGVICVGAVGSV